MLIFVQTEVTKLEEQITQLDNAMTQKITEVDELKVKVKQMEDSKQEHQQIVEQYKVNHIQ